MPDLMCQGEAAAGEGAAAVEHDQAFAAANGKTALAAAEVYQPHINAQPAREFLHRHRQTSPQPAVEHAGVINRTHRFSVFRHFIIPYICFVKSFFT